MNGRNLSPSLSGMPPQRIPLLKLELKTFWSQAQVVGNPTSYEDVSDCIPFSTALSRVRAVEMNILAAVSKPSSDALNYRFGIVRRGILLCYYMKLLVLCLSSSRRERIVLVISCITSAALSTFVIKPPT